MKGVRFVAKTKWKTIITKQMKRIINNIINKNTD